MTGTPRPVLQRSSVHVSSRLKNAAVDCKTDAGGAADSSNEPNAVLECRRRAPGSGTVAGHVGDGDCMAMEIEANV
jgi:hypothetical protein